MTGASRRPRFSIVSAVYDVEPYLPAFMRSVERLRARHDEVEVVAVDDGSTDGSLDLLLAWARRSRFKVKVFTKPNGGQGSARNLGLDHATGEWVTFPDPDDVLEPDYLRAAGHFAAVHPGVEAMSARPVLLHEATGRLSADHPRAWQYRDGNRLADLDAEPNVFLGLAPGSFYRLDRIAAGGVRFDERIRPNFEDAHFAVRYLLDLPRPIIGLLRNSVYVYRKRAAGTSTLQRSARDPGRYSDVLEHGYLDIVTRSRRADGSVPEWVQQLLIYELSWYLSEDERIAGSTEIPADLEARFHALLERILRALDPAVVARHHARALSQVWVDLLAHAGRDGTWRAPVIDGSRLDRAMRLRRYQYRYVGRQPSEAFRAGGRNIEPAFAKTVAHRYFGREFLWQRILWLQEAPGIEIELDGEAVAIATEEPPSRSGHAPMRASLGDRWWVYRRQPPRLVGAARRWLQERLARDVFDPVLRALARSAPFARRYAGAWVLMDRIHDADDNGERLFEYLRATRSDVNAWFVLERGTPDWERLRARGEQRLVAHGSWTWKMLMLNCAWLLASHVDVAIARPPEIMRIHPEPIWRFGFLQHGVIKDDLSRWLNRREIDMFVVSTEAELASIADDGTGYLVTHKETRNTGLPRFDRLLAKGRAVPADQRDLVIVAPTWRQWLTLPLASGSQRRKLDSAFWESDYIRNWTALLGSRKIADLVAQRGWRLGFMPHPNLQSMLAQLDLPAHVEPLSFAGVDVQELYGRCALLVTDYSSVAFNVAYIDRPIVYFQFDRDSMLGGSHVGRRGYFEYARDGFGPIAEDLQTAELAIVAAIERGPWPAPEYQRRISATFPVRDGGACARVVAAVEDMSRPWAAGMPAGPLPQETGGESPRREQADQLAVGQTI